MEQNSTMERLEDQLKWYDQKSAWNQKRFKYLKMAEIVAAAMIPFVAGFSGSQYITGINSAYITGILGITVVILEGIQSLYQFQSLWISYRTTAEGLKHEKYLWLAQAGPYLHSENPAALFADRVEALISTEHAKWVVDVVQAAKQKEKSE